MGGFNLLQALFNRDAGQQDDPNAPQVQNPMAPAPQPVQSPMQQFLQPPAPQEPEKSIVEQTSPIADTKLPDDEESLANRFLRGYITRASKAGEMPSPEQFDQRFAKSVSPAREVLANALFGMSAGLTGTQFRGLRERKFDEYKVQVDQQERRQAHEQQLVTNIMQLQEKARIAKEANKVKVDLAEAARAQTSAQWKEKMLQMATKNNIDISKLGLEDRKVKVAEGGLDLKKQQAMAERDNFKDVKDADLQWGLKEAAARMRGEGKDPHAPENQNDLYDTANDLSSTLYRNRQKANNEFKKESGPKYQKLLIQGPDNVEVGSFDPTTGAIHSGPSYWNKDKEGNILPQQYSVSPAERASFKEEQAAIDSFRQVLNVASSNPSAVGGMLKNLPAAMQAYFKGDIPRDNRQIQSFLQQGFNQYLKAGSGKQVTVSEEGRYSKGMPKIYESAGTFVPGMMMTLNFMEATMLRKKYNINPEEIGFADIYEAKEKAAIEELKAAKREGRPPVLPNDSAQSILKNAILSKGKTPIIDESTGAIRGYR